MMNIISNALGNPVLMRKLNGWMVIFWIIMIPVALITGWISSVVFVSAISIWALVAGHASSWQSARVEVHQEEDANVQETLDEIRNLKKIVQEHLCNNNEI